MFTIEGIAAFIFILGVLVFFHELGHFLVARKTGVKALKFSLGFGPKIIGKKVGDTEYLLSAIPLGGYVKLLGEEPGEELSPEERVFSFSDQPVWKRAAIVAAGPIFNMILAFLIFSVIFSFGVPVIKSQIGDVQKDSPAEKAGLMKDDTIIAIDGKEIAQWEEIKVDIEKKKGEELEFTIDRHGSQIILNITPELKSSKNIFGEDKETWMIGILPKGSYFTKRYNPVTSLYLGFKRTIEITGLTIVGIIKLIEGVIPTSTIGGPILIAQIAQQQTEQGLLNVLLFVAILSINLGILNLLPIPILDGGHLLFFAIEAIMGKPLSIKKREIAQQVGLFLLILLMIFAFYNDIMRIFTG
ncbi:MAG: RIP metalloprotease RseP [Nitrospirota bacterium]